MNYSTAQQGRAFIIRLEDGDILHECIERLAAKEGVKAGILVAVGGADEGSKLVVGPEESRATPVVPMTLALDGVCELAGIGTLFPDDTGAPVLHMHASCGRRDKAVTGCVRAGVKTWHVLEVVLIELVGATAVRRPDAATGFKLLQP